jgi:hypothetical protein
MRSTLFYTLKTNDLSSDVVAAHEVMVITPDLLLHPVWKGLCEEKSTRILPGFTLAHTA